VLELLELGVVLGADVFDVVPDVGQPGDVILERAIEATLIVFFNI
jgi:hypothetical protein